MSVQLAMSPPWKFGVATGHKAEDSKDERHCLLNPRMVDAEGALTTHILEACAAPTTARRKRLLDSVFAQIADLGKEGRVNVWEFGTPCGFPIGFLCNMGQHRNQASSGLRRSCLHRRLNVYCFCPKRVEC